MAENPIRHLESEEVGAEEAVKFDGLAISAVITNSIGDRIGMVVGKLAAAVSKARSVIVGVES